MKKYTEEELYHILCDTKRSGVPYTAEDRARVLHNPNLVKWREGMCALGEQLRAQQIAPIPFSVFRRFETDGDRSEYESSSSPIGYFTRRKRLMTFALLSWLYQKPEDIAALEDIIWAICDEYTWALPAHLWGTGLSKVQTDAQIIDLFAAETGEAFAEILSLVEPLLHPIVAMRMRRELRVRIFERYEEDYSWKKWINNWAAVCAGSCGMAAIYEMEDDRALAHLLADVLASMECFLSGYPEDGTCLEGVGYWEYGFGYFTCFADALLRRTEGRIDLFADEKVHKIAVFKNKCIFPRGRAVSFADSGSRGAFSLADISFFGKKYSDISMPPRKYIPEKEYEFYGCYRFALNLHQAVNMTDVLPPEEGEEPQGTYLMPDAEWYISTAKDGTSIAAKGGHNNEPHNHNDVGSFEIYRNGEELLCDLGGGIYSRDYFSAKRYEIFCCSSRGHSLPIVNGTYQLAGESHRAQRLSLTDGGLRADIASAYGDPTLRSLVREISFDRTSGQVRLCDSYCFSEAPSELTERFVTRIEPRCEKDAVLIDTGKERLRIFYDTERLTPRIGTENESMGAGRQSVTYTVDFLLKTAEKEFALTFLLQ